MKKIFALLVFVVSWAAAQAQWSVEVDARIAPWGGERANLGTDIVASYKLPVGGFYIAPSAGIFYKNYYQSTEYYGGPNYPHWGYQTCVDVAVVAGKGFKLGSGMFSVFTGPRYGYAFASKCHLQSDFVPHSLDWRLGVDYSFSKFTVSAKCDIAMLKYQKDTIRSRYNRQEERYEDYICKYDERQVSVLVVGLAYNF